MASLWGGSPSGGRGSLFDFEPRQQSPMAGNIGAIGALVQDLGGALAGRPDRVGAAQALAEKQRQEETQKQLVMALNSDDPDLKQRAYRFAAMNGMDPEKLKAAFEKPQDKFENVGGALYRIPGAGGLPTLAVDGPKKPKPMRSYESGGEKITEEMNDDGTWSRLGQPAPRWAPARRPAMAASPGGGMGGVASPGAPQGVPARPLTPKEQAAADDRRRQQEGALEGYQAAIGTLDKLIGAPVIGKDGKPDFSQMKPMEGFNEAVGFGWEKLARGAAPWVDVKDTTPGTARADFVANLDTLKSQTFLPMVQQLKGMGALSNAEGEKLTNAIGALDTNMSEEAFKRSAWDIRQRLANAAARAVSNPQTAQAGPGAVPMPPARPSGPAGLPQKPAAGRTIRFEDLP